MWSGLIEVGYIGLENTEELLLMQDKQMIETFSAHASQEALTVRVSSRSMERRLQHLYFSIAGHVYKEWPELAIIVADEEPGRLPIGCRFSQRLRNPSIGRMAGYADVDYPAFLQLNDEEGKERAKKEVRYWQEVASPALVRMIVQEGGPASLRKSVCAHVASTFGSCVLRREFPSFRNSPRMRSAPHKRLWSRHRFDQSEGLGRDFGFL
jgi:hypothetical protein